MTFYKVLRRFFSVTGHLPGKWKSKTQEALERQAAELREQLRLQAIDRYNKQFIRKEKNILAPSPVYEGPRNVRYWIKRRRSGMRK